MNGNTRYNEPYYETPRQSRSHAGIIVGAALLLALGGVGGVFFGRMAAKSGITPQPARTQIVQYQQTKDEIVQEQSYSLIGETQALQNALASLGFDGADSYTINLVENGSDSYYDVTIYEGEDVYNVQVAAYTN